MELAGCSCARRERLRAGFKFHSLITFHLNNALLLQGLEHTTQGFQSTLVELSEKARKPCSTLSVALMTALLCYYFSCCLFLKSRNLKLWSFSLYISWSAVLFTSMPSLLLQLHSERSKPPSKGGATIYTTKSQHHSVFFFFNNSHHSNHILAFF